MCELAAAGYPGYVGLLFRLADPPPADPDPFVSAWLARVRAKMRSCGCPSPVDLAPGPQ